MPRLMLRRGSRSRSAASGATSPRGAPGAAPDLRLLRRARWRLVAWSGGMTLAAFLALSVVIYWAVAASLASGATAQLEGRAGQLVSQLLSAPGAAPGFVDPRGAAVLAPDPAKPGVVFGGASSGTLGIVVSVRASGSLPSYNGGPTQVAIPSPAPGQRSVSVRAGGDAAGPLGGAGLIAKIAQRAIDAAGAASAGSGGTSVHAATIDGTPVRILTEFITRDGQPYLVQVVGDRSAEERTLQTLLLVLAAGGVLTVALSLGVGYVYAGRALVPIRDSLRRQREFAADASHELRTPLAVVRASVEHLQRHPEARVADLGSALRDIDTESGRLADLVEQLLLLARVDSGSLEIERESTDLSEAAAQACAGLRALADHASVALELDVEPAPLLGDPRRLRQLAAILIDNAIRHSPEGGKVRVRSRLVGADVVLDVDDEGSGISPGDLPHVFERFYRASGAPPGGTGLGLAIAQWIVTRHGGTIHAENLPERGARFQVRLPGASDFHFGARIPGGE